MARLRLPGHIKQGDTAPYLDALLTDYAGQPVDVTGANVRFLMRQSTGTTVKVDAAGSVVDGAAGHVRYALQASDTDTAGTYHCEYEITFADGRIETFPNDDKPLVLNINAQIG